MKVINCVYSRNKLDFKKFSKNAKFDDVISYHDIITKLIKNDSKNDKPSAYVINSYIRRKLIKSVTDKNISVILYAIKNLDIETIDYIKSLIEENYAGDFQFNLIIVKNKRSTLEISDSLDNHFSKITHKDL